MLTRLTGVATHSLAGLKLMANGDKSILKVLMILYTSLLIMRHSLPETHWQSRLNQLYFQSRILLTLKWNYVFTNDLVYFAKKPATAVFQQITGFRIINRPHGTLQTQTL